MKAITIVNLFLYSLLVLPGQNPARAQETTKAPEETAHSASRGSTKWEKVDRAHVLRIWQLKGEITWPQVSILRVTNATYIKYLQAPEELVEFVNLHEIFSKKVMIAGPWVSLSSVEEKQKEKQKDPDCWVLTLLHGKQSTMLVSALPEFKTEPPNLQCVP